MSSSPPEVAALSTHLLKPLQSERGLSWTSWGEKKCPSCEASEGSCWLTTPVKKQKRVMIMKIIAFFSCTNSEGRHYHTKYEPGRNLEKLLGSVNLMMQELTEQAISSFTGKGGCLYRLQSVFIERAKCSSDTNSQIWRQPSANMITITGLTAAD